MSRPNILYIHSHDTGRYIQPYGHALATPHLQQLAEGGIILRNAFSAAPTCSPSRAALLTGQSPHQSGMLGLAHRGFRLNDPKQHLAHTLGAAGYHTVLAGLQHVATDPAQTGYAQIFQPEKNHAAQVSEAAAAFLESKPSTPFFLDVGFFETHREFPDPALSPAHMLPPAPLPNTPETRQDMAAYAASARRLDDGVGRVLAALDTAELANDTLVIYTTDHGLAFPMMKCNLTDHGMGVSLILRGPEPFGGDRAGTACDALISQIDLFPTLCEWLDIQPPTWLTGRSFLPAFLGQVAEINQEVFGEVTYHAAYEPQRAVRTPRYKYIRRYGERATPVLPNCDDSLSKEVLLRHGWSAHTVPREALYDLIYDPQESHNLIDAADYVEIREDMRRRLNRWMMDTDDPLLLGSVRAPVGARINDPAGLSPQEPTAEAF